MVYMKSSIASALIGAAALSATASALPANANTRNLDQGPGLVRVDVALDAPKLQLPRDPRETNASAHRRNGMETTSQESWRGQPKRRGPWRQSQGDGQLIDVNLGSEDTDPHRGDLINIQARRHNDVVVVERPAHEIDYVDDHAHIHEHNHGNDDGVKVVHKRHDDVVEVVEEPVLKHVSVREHLGRSLRGVPPSRRSHRMDVIEDPVHEGHEHISVHEHGGRLDRIVAARHETRHYDHETTIVDAGRHDTTVVTDAHRHGNDVVVEHKRRSTAPGPAFLKRHSGMSTVIDQGRHDTTVVTGAGRHETVVTTDDHGHNHGTTIVDRNHEAHSDDEDDSHLSKRYSSGRILVLGDDKRYRDTEYYHGSLAHVERLGRPMYFGNGGELNRVQMVTSVPWDYEYGYAHHGFYARHHDGDGITVVHDGREGDVTVVGSDRHRHDTTIVNTKRHAGHGDDDDANIKAHANPKSNASSGDVDGKGRHNHDLAKASKASNEPKAPKVKRDTDAMMGGAPGYIDVTSPVFNSTTAQRIASLVLSTTNGTDSNSTFVLNASNNIRTQVYLVPIAADNATAADLPDSGSGSGSGMTGNGTGMGSGTGTIGVHLKLPIFVASSASVEPYCATFDPTPDAPESLTVEPCTDTPDAHQSQNFLYDPATGVISPDWTPSAAAQELLQSVGDSVDDDDNESNDGTSGDDTDDADDDDGSDNDDDGDSVDDNSADTEDTDGSNNADVSEGSDSMDDANAADPYEDTMEADALGEGPASDSASSTISPSTSSTAPAIASSPAPSSGTITAAPTSSPSSSMATATTTTTSNPPPLSSSGPQASTDSTALPAGASNVTLIFSPANPSLSSASVDAGADADADTDAGAASDSTDGWGDSDSTSSATSISSSTPGSVSAPASTSASGASTSSSSSLISSVTAPAATKRSSVGTRDIIDSNRAAQQPMSPGSWTAPYELC